MLTRILLRFILELENQEKTSLMRNIIDELKLMGVEDENIIHFP